MGEFERRIARYVCRTRFEDLPRAAVEVVRKMLLADVGTTIAGARADGCETLVRFFRSGGGRPEATVLVHGGKLPAQSAAFVNAVMSRALDFCDAIAPGPHIGSSVIPAALACAELAGRCDGRALLTALVVGTEVAARMNLTESAYDGFDPTGICVPFGAAAAACRLLGLDEQQTLNALGLVFNRCGGSFQSHIDGSLGVRVTQGWVAQDAVASTLFARHGITGPTNFLAGLYGYLHLYGRGELSATDLFGGLGDEYRLREVAFKKYPSCAMTAGPTDLTIALLREQAIDPHEVAAVRVTLPPYGFRLVGHAFKIGDNPTVDGQFSAQYCVANVLLRGDSKLRHFTPEAVRDPEVARYVQKVAVAADPALDRRGHTATDVEILMSDGTLHRRTIDVAPGFPGNDLTEEDHRRRFADCVDFARENGVDVDADAIFALIADLESLDDVRRLIALLTPGS